MLSRDTAYCELLFQSNPGDAARMRQPGYHFDTAEAICRGLATMYGFPFVPAFTQLSQDWRKEIAWVAFSGAAAVGGKGFFSTASTDGRHLYDVSPGAPLRFDGGVRGQMEEDVVLHAGDNRWYHRAAPDFGWTALAWVEGDAPNSTPR